MTKQKLTYVGWVATHQGGNHSAHIWNNQVDSLTHLASLVKEGEEEKWEHLLEWLHVKHGHSGVKDLLKETVSRGWPVTQELRSTVISACGLCCTRLEKHRLQDSPLYPWVGKGLWETWQIDYIGPFKRSEGKRYVLIGVEVVSGLVQAGAVSRATGENTVEKLKLWFCFLPKPK